MSDRPVVVPAATGRQGRAAVRALIEHGHHVRALVRDATRPDAVELADAGAEVIVAGLDDAAAIAATLADSKGLFLAQPGFISPQATPGLGPDDELRRGRVILDLAAAVDGVHVVFGSSIGADRADVGAMLRPKHVLEQHVRELGVPATVLRPVGFMENHAGPHRGLSPDGTMSTLAPPDVPEQLIAVRDIGRFVAHAFDHPDLFVGAELDIAGDELTTPEIAQAIGRATGRTIAYRQIPAEVARADNPVRYEAIASLYRADRPTADIAASRGLIPELLTFAEWLKSTDAAGLHRYLRRDHG